MVIQVERYSRTKKEKEKEKWRRKQSGKVKKEKGNWETNRCLEKRKELIEVMRKGVQKKEIGWMLGEERTNRLEVMRFERGTRLMVG